MIRKNKKEEKAKTDDQVAPEHAYEKGAIPDETSESLPGEDTGAGLSNKPAPTPDSQLAELQDKYLRLYSDFDNYRKRTLKEKAEHSKYAATEIILRLLPVLDDFERALKACNAAPEADQAVRDGMVLIFNKFLSILQQQGLQQMRTAGELFDTDFHEAITNIPAPQPDQKGRILDETEKGYILNGKVIRFAKVVVGS